MSNKQNEEIAEMKMDTIHYDLEQTLREARRESGMTLNSIAKTLVEVLDQDEINLLIYHIEYASSERELHKETK